MFIVSRLASRARSSCVYTKFIQKRFFSMQFDPEDLMPGSKKEKEQKPITKEIRILSTMDSYKEGVKLTIDKEYSEAEKMFRATLDALEMDEDRFNPKVWSIVLQKLALTMKLQNKNKELTEVLEEIYFSAISDNMPDLDQVYKFFGNLATHYALYDIDRGIVFCESVLQNHENQPIPMAHLKEVLYYIGTLFLLKGENYKRGIDILTQCLELKPHPIIRGNAMHNLACGVWWNGLEEVRQESDKPVEDVYDASNTEQQFKLYEKNDVESTSQEDYGKIVPLLKKAIKSFEFLFPEDVDQFPRKEADRLTPEQLTALAKLLSENTKAGELKDLKIEKVAMKNPLSALSAMNIGEFFFQTHDVQSALIWIKCSLKCSVRTETIPRTLRSMVILAMLTEEQKDAEFSEKLYLDCLGYMEGMSTFNKVFCLDMYSRFLANQGRKYEAKNYRDQSRKLYELLPSWYERKECLQIPDYQM